MYIASILAFLLPFGSFFCGYIFQLLIYSRVLSFLLPFGSFECRKQLLAYIKEKLDAFYSLLGVSSIAAAQRALAPGAAPFYSLLGVSYIFIVKYLLEKEDTIELSTPFWEFLWGLAISLTSLGATCANLSTPFWEFPAEAAGAGQRHNNGV